MGQLRNIMTPLHRRTSRDYLARMQDDKVHCMRVARAYEYDYWDGDRRYGYGGYSYDGRWQPVAASLVELYDLQADARILDVGCGKAHILYELSLLLPGAELVGYDVSVHGIGDAPEPIRDRLQIHPAEQPYPWPDDHFDLVISTGALHNLRLFDLGAALAEIARVSRQQYVMVESYRNEAELFNLQCWALTAEAFFATDEWVWLFEHFGYHGDYEFIFFE